MQGTGNTSLAVSLLGISGDAPPVGIDSEQTLDKRSHPAGDLPLRALRLPLLVARLSSNRKVLAMVRTDPASASNIQTPSNLLVALVPSNDE